MGDMSPNVMRVCRVSGVAHAAAAHTELAETLLLPVILAIFAVLRFSLLCITGCIYSLREHISVPTAFHIPSVHVPNFARPTLPDADIESSADVALLSSQQSSHQ